MTDENQEPAGAMTAEGVLQKALEWYDAYCNKEGPHWADAEEALLESIDVYHAVGQPGLAQAERLAELQRALFEEQAQRAQQAQQVVELEARVAALENQREAAKWALQKHEPSQVEKENAQLLDANDKLVSKVLDANKRIIELEARVAALTEFDAWLTKNLSMGNMRLVNETTKAAEEWYAWRRKLSTPPAPASGALAVLAAAIYMEINETAQQGNPTVLGESLLIQAQDEVCKAVRAMDPAFRALVEGRAHE